MLMALLPLVIVKVTFTLSDYYSLILSSCQEDNIYNLVNFVLFFTMGIIKFGRKIYNRGQGLGEIQNRISKIEYLKLKTNS